VSRPGKRRSAAESSCAAKLPSVALVSLGCPKNLVDSETMACLLENSGFRAAGDIHGADVLIINTCGFVEDATEESLERIAEGLEHKAEGSVKKVVAAGCLVQRMGKRLIEEFPELDGAVGTGSWPGIGDVCRLVLAGERGLLRLDPPGQHTPPATRNRSSFGHFAYLKVTEGCHRHCSYCVIPSLRGPLRSTPPDVVLSEAEALVGGGARELILVGEDIGAYGAEKGAGWSLAGLLRELNGVRGVEWIRMMYVHPGSVAEPLIEAAEECEKVCAYIDLPIQHAADGVLSRMNRPTGRADLERVMKMLKASPKEFAVRTTVMVGFPGETPSDFNDLMSFVKEWEFDHLGAFCYSPEGGTDASGYPSQVGGAVKEDRKSKIMQLQAEISLKKNSEKVNSVLDVLVDEGLGEGRLAARTERQAPQVDGCTLVSGSIARPGEFVSVRITGSDVYDLHAVPAMETSS
jgi:ribosomal protein S12 methylthiotransferase